MSIAGSPVMHQVADDRAETEFEIDVKSRWDALALWELLIRFDPSLVHQTHERWIVQARVPGRDGEALAAAMRAIEEWQAERNIDASLRIVRGSDDDRLQAEGTVSAPAHTSNSGG